MKANEAPEKIYMTPSFGEPDNILLASFSKSHLNFYRDIEYTRTDAFIEKAKMWMLTHTYMFQSMEEVDLYIEMFIKEMKGE